MTVAAIVLAAGTSTRFGAQKLLAPLAGKPVIRWTVEHVRAWGVDDVLVVLGRDGPAIREALSDLALRWVTNDRYAEGLSTSLRAGIAALPPDTHAALIALGDQPTISPAVSERVLERYRETGALIVAPVYRGVRGNPVLFDAALFPELLGIRGDEGARAVVARDESRVATIELDEPMPPDVDAEADLAAIARSMAAAPESRHSRVPPG